MVNGLGSKEGEDQEHTSLTISPPREWAMNIMGRLCSFNPASIEPASKTIKTHSVIPFPTQTIQETYWMFEQAA